MKTLHRYIYLILLILLASLVGCSAPVIPTLSTTSTLTSPAATPLPTVVLSPTPTPQLPTDMPTPSPIPPTHTPTANPILPTRTPSPTLAPTMTADEEYTFVLEMLRDNAGCQLPCWWGFTPGETFWQAAETFFALRGKEIGEYSSSRETTYDVGFIVPQYNVWFRQYYTVNDSTIDIISIHTVPPVEDGHYVYGDPQFVEDWKPYMLPQVLEVYGPPPQVFLGLGGAAWLPFDLLLFYPEKGILVQYSGSAERSEEETLLVCPHRVEITLYLWVPEQYTALEDVPGIGSYTYAADEMSDLFSLEEATGMSIGQFYQTFVQPDNQTCLETPVDMW